MHGLPNSVPLSDRLDSPPVHIIRLYFFENSKKDIVILILYVDDMIITGNDISSIVDLKQTLSQ